MNESHDRCCQNWNYQPAEPFCGVNSIDKNDNEISNELHDKINFKTPTKHLKKSSHTKNWIFKLISADHSHYDRENILNSVENSTLPWWIIDSFGSGNTSSRRFMETRFFWNSAAIYFFLFISKTSQSHTWFVNLNKNMASHWEFTRETTEISEIRLNTRWRPSVLMWD